MTDIAKVIAEVGKDADGVAFNIVLGIFIREVNILADNPFFVQWHMLRL
jgi:hypothetical protein